MNGRDNMTFLDKKKLNTAAKKNGWNNSGRKVNGVQTVDSQSPAVTATRARSKVTPVNTDAYHRR